MRWRHLLPRGARLTAIRARIGCLPRNGRTALARVNVCKAYRRCSHRHSSRTLHISSLRFRVRATNMNGELTDVTPGSMVTKIRIDLEKQSQLGITEVEIYNSHDERIPLVLPNQIPMQRSTASATAKEWHYSGTIPASQRSKP